MKFMELHMDKYITNGAVIILLPSIYDGNGKYRQMKRRKDVK